MSGGIFISYRRQDAAHAGRLSDALARRYGKANVVFDVDTIAPGADFGSRLHDAVHASEVLIAVIGPAWAVATDAEGRRRIDDPGDFVRVEIAAAIAQEKWLIPALVGGASMPSPDQLPPDIAPLAHRNALQLRDEGYAQALDQLFHVIDRMLPLAAGQTPAPPAAIATSPTPMSAKPAATLSFLQRMRMAVAILRGGALPAPPAPDSLEASPPGPTRSAGAPHSVFLSYSSTDLQLLEQIAGVLEHAGHRCWYAPRNIPASSPNWPRAIVEAIAKSRLMVILVTKQSMASEQVLREVTIAADEKVPLLPFSLERVPLPPDFKYFFSLGQRLELTGVPTGQAIRQLQSSVANRLGA